MFGTCLRNALVLRHYLPVQRQISEKMPDVLSGTGDSQRDSSESICANHSQLKLLFL